MVRIKKLIIILIGIFIINGCTLKNETDMNINTDGEFNYSILVTIDKNTLSSILKAQDENTEVTDESMLKYMEETINYPFINDLEKTKYSNDEYIGMKYTYKVDHIDNISGQDINEVNLNVYNSKERLKDKKLFRKDGARYTANFTYNFDNNDYDINSINYINEFSVTLPFEAHNHNASHIENNGRTLKWVLDNKTDQNIKFTFSLVDVKLISKSVLTIGLCIIVLIIILILFSTQQKKKKVLFTIPLAIMIVTIISLNINSFETQNTFSQYFIGTEINKNNIKYENNTIYLYFDNLNTAANTLNKILNYTDSTSNLYTSITTKLMKNDNSTKMYDDHNNKILETKIDKEKATKLFGNYVNIKDDITLKVIFNNTENENTNNINNIVNRETIMRQKIVETALAQEGNTGEEYWTWYGYNHRVEWCAVFVSWVTEQHGYISAGKAPKFVGVRTGVNFYKKLGRFKEGNSYTPLPGDIIFFNWNENELIDHVGLVEKVENGYVHTIEGNVKYLSVERRKYKQNSSWIYGYGVPEY